MARRACAVRLQVLARMQKWRAGAELSKKIDTLLDLCVSSLRRGHANLLCVVPILSDDPRRESVTLARCGIRVCCKGVCCAVLELQQPQHRQLAFRKSATWCSFSTKGRLSAERHAPRFGPRSARCGPRVALNTYKKRTHTKTRHALLRASGCALCGVADRSHPKSMAL